MVDLPPDELLAAAASRARSTCPAQAERAARQLLPQGQPASRCASWRCAAPPTASTTRCWPTGANQAVEIGVADARSAARLRRRRRRTARSWCAAPPAWRRSSTCRGTRCTSRRRALQRLPRRAAPARRCACSSWRRSSAPITATLAAPEPAAALVALRARAQPRRAWCSGAHPRRWPWRRTLAERIAALADELDLMRDRAAGRARGSAPRRARPASTATPSARLAGLRCGRARAAVRSRC